MSATAPVTDPLTDRQRLTLIGRIDLDNPLLRAELDRIAARTAARTGLPVGGVVLVLRSAQVFAGAAGLPDWLAEADGTPIEWSICASIVTSGRPYLLADALADPRHATNPLVSNGIIGSYAGVPITAEGHILGAVCIIGTAPHTFTGRDMQALRDAATEAETIIRQHTDPQ